MRSFNERRINRSTLLKKIELKEPDVIYKGTQDYLRFMKELGLVLRITCSNINILGDFYRRVHPNMIASIGWINTENVSLYIYPGFELEDFNALKEINKAFAGRTHIDFEKIKRRQFSPMGHRPP